MTTEWWTELKSITLHAAGDPPPLWASGASAEYQNARQALVTAEIALRDQIEAVAAQRRALPPGPVVPNYQLTEGALNLTAESPTTPVTLAELFGEHDELIVYHLMFHPDDDAACAACSMIVDGVSTYGTRFTTDLGYRRAVRRPVPGVQRLHSSRRRDPSQLRR